MMQRGEPSKIVQDPEAMALELWAQIEVLTDQLKRLADGIETARNAGQLFNHLRQIMKTFEEELNRLAETVAGVTEVVPAVVATIGDLANKFKANANDPTRVAELADKLFAAKTQLAEAIVAGTPSAPPIVEEPATPATPTDAPTPADPAAAPTDGG
jgi:prophage DNA circulation protein